jgi:branched-chain amino acid transport system substrate-binding protein
MVPHRLRALLLVLAAAALVPARAQKAYDPGANDTTVRIGNFMPYSGPFREYGAVGRAEAAYFRMINDKGGVRGRKIEFVTVDGGPFFRDVTEQVRKLVEDTPVLFFAGTFGSLPNKRVRPYLNDHKVPQLFVASSDSTFADPAHFPWTLGFVPTKRAEAAALGRFVLGRMPDARIGILSCDDEDGAEYRAGFREGLGDRAGALVAAQETYSLGRPEAVAAKVEALRKAGATVFANFAVGRAAAEGLRASFESGWRPFQVIPNVSISIPAFLEPVGTEKAVGIYSTARSKGWSQANAREDPAVAEFLDWKERYDPSSDPREAMTVVGYLVAQTVVEVVRRCGDDLTRANVLAQATHLDLELGMLRQGIRVRTTPTDYTPIKDFYLVRFDGRGWVPVTGALER